MRPRRLRDANGFIDDSDSLRGGVIAADFESGVDQRRVDDPRLESQHHSAESIAGPIAALCFEQAAVAGQPRLRYYLTARPLCKVPRTSPTSARENSSACAIASTLRG